MRKIFDIHMHFPRNWEKPDADPAPPVQHLYEQAKAAGITKANLLCGGRFGISHKDSIKLAQKYPDLFIPTAMIDPETTTPKDLRELKRMGYRGLKMIGVLRDYDCPDYFPVYEAAEKFGWPVLLHMGVIGGGIDYRVTHPRRDKSAAEAYARWSKLFQGARNVSAMRMRPFHLDTIANNFPALRLIGAHLGGTGNYDEAASVARWRHNVYFDFSGGTTIERHAVERRLIGHEIGFEKLIFGSDTSPEKIAEHIRRWDTIFDLLDVPADARERMWWLNGAEVYGEEPIRWLKEQRAAKAAPPVRVRPRDAGAAPARRRRAAAAATRPAAARATAAKKPAAKRRRR
ncbi:MAG TPA: amidohydrolase family protein [Dehalococcoidia bacterium]|nr:amidohydrolase family protein [Dehalococcoidia bacterium]